VLQEERSFVRVSAGFRKTLTLRFFGIGPTTNERDETSYTDETFFVDATISNSLSGSLQDVVVSFSVAGETHRLSGGKVAGKPDTDSVPRFQPLFDDADQSMLGWVNAGIAWDTRDSVRNPYRGSTIGANVRAALLQSNGTTGAVYSVFANKIFSLPPLFHDGGDANEEHPPTDSLGFHFQTELSSGSLPFFARPTLGGSIIQRGYIAGRWRDDAAWAAAAEYRFWVVPRGFTLWKNIRVERLGGAIFYEVGGVGEDGLALLDSSVIHTYGFGGRATIERAVLFRFDLGFSDEGMNLAVGFGLTF
jgi:outer membrane protein assembly factor BamA